MGTPRLKERLAKLSGGVAVIKVPSIYLSTYLPTYLAIYPSIYLSRYGYKYMWQRIKNIGLVTGLGGHFATKVCSRWGCSATDPSATSPLKTTVLSTEVRDKGL